MRGLLLLFLIVGVGCGGGTSGSQRVRKHRSRVRKQAALKKKEELLDKARDLIAEGEMLYAKMCDADGFRKSSFHRKATSRVDEALRILHQLCVEFPEDDEVQRVTQRAQRLKEAIIKDSPIR